MGQKRHTSHDFVPQCFSVPPCQSPLPALIDRPGCSLMTGTATELITVEVTVRVSMPWG